jgi:hypothetical protein
MATRQWLESFVASECAANCKDSGRSRAVCYPELARSASNLCKKDRPCPRDCTETLEAACCSEGRASVRWNSGRRQSCKTVRAARHFGLHCYCCYLLAGYCEAQIWGFGFGICHSAIRTSLTCSNHSSLAHPVCVCLQVSPLHSAWQTKDS